MRPPLFSVITVSFNSVKTIERTLLSVANQSYRQIEHIVVDGGSTDGTVDLLHRHRASLVSYVSEPDSGIYDAMNKGIRLAKGDWIHLLNSDDFYTSPESIARAVERLDPAATNYFAIWQLFADGTKRLQDWKYRRWQLFVSAFLPHPGLIVSRTQYEVVGPYSTRYRIAADHDMILRLTARWPGTRHALPLVTMLQGGCAGSNMRTSLDEFREVTIAHGLPPVVANAIMHAKHAWWHRGKG